MPHTSDALFRTLHALRIKGFAKVDSIAELAELPLAEAAGHLAALAERESATFREARELWQITPAGRDEHRRAIDGEVEQSTVDELSERYPQFLALGERFKELCSDWQLRDGVPNDHCDPRYDLAIVAELAVFDAAAAPVVAGLGEVLHRLGGYARRLEQTCQRVVGGETNMFTGVMCGSYHEVWMELHEDLILTQRIDRVAGNDPMRASR